MRAIWLTCALLLAVSCGGNQHNAAPNGAGASSGAGGRGAGPDAGDVDASSGAGAGSGSIGSSGSVGAAGEAGAAGEIEIEIEPDDGLKSGTRLKIEWHDYGSTRKFADFYDTVLETPCTPRAWADGKTYCVPVSSASLRYANTACTEIVADVSHNIGCPRAPVPYLVEASESGCSASSAHVYRLNPSKLTLEKIFALQSGSCAGPFSGSSDYDDYYASVGEVQPAELAEFNREPLADSDRLSRQYLVSPDGARFPIAPRDRLLDTDCTPKSDFLMGTVGSCAPVSLVHAIYFGDMACTQGKLNVQASCPKPNFTVQIVDPSCPLNGSNYFRVGAAEAASPTFSKRDTECVATTLSGSGMYYGLGESVSIRTLSRAHDFLAGRDLVPIHFNDGKKRFLDSNMYDAAHDTECVDYVFPDGSVRCVPISNGVSSYYSDDQCMTLVNVIQVVAPLARCNVPSNLTRFEANANLPLNEVCSAGFEMFESGPEYTGMLFQNSGTCTPVDRTRYRFYGVGPQHALTEFPLATTVREP